MTIELVDNRNKNHGPYVNKILNSKDHVTILVAFLKWSGLKEFEKKIKNLVSRGTKVEIYVGLNFYISEPKALKSLYGIIKGKSNSKLYLVNGKKNTFHPKIYCGVNGRKAQFLVGSANMTAGGMSSNFEVSSYFEVDTSSEYYVDFREYTSAVASNKKAIQADLILINQYELDYKVFKQKQKKAESEAEKEIKAKTRINPADLMKFLKLYKADDEVLADFQLKRNNYRKAKKLIGLLVSGDIPKKSEFVVLYEQLVGAAGQKSLWHSDFLYRHKSGVINQYRAFIGMLKEIDKNIGRPAEILFDIGLSHSKNIKGIGVNVITEIMNTYSPKKYSVLNNNPLSSLKHLGYSDFKGTMSFKGEDYLDYNSLITEFARICEFKDLSQVDHFLNYVYWKFAKKTL